MNYLMHINEAFHVIIDRNLVLLGFISKWQLTSEASQHVVPVVRSMLLHAAQLQQSVIAVEVTCTSSSMSCWPCFRNMEKVLRLRKEVGEAGV